MTNTDGLTSRNGDKTGPIIRKADYNSLAVAHLEPVHFASESLAYLIGSIRRVCEKGLLVPSCLSISPFVMPYGTTWLPLDRFS